MRELTKGQLVAAKRLPSEFWNRIVMAMFRARYIEENEVLEASVALCNFIADEIDDIKDGDRARFEKVVAGIAKIMDCPDKAMRKQIPTVFSYKMNGLRRHIPIERLEFCCKYLQAAAWEPYGEDVVLAFKGFETDENGDTWFAECPFCGAKLVVNDRGMIVKGMGEC